MQPQVRRLGPDHPIEPDGGKVPECHLRPRADNGQLPWGSGGKLVQNLIATAKVAGLGGIVFLSLDMLL